MEALAKEPRIASFDGKDESVLGALQKSRCGYEIGLTGARLWTIKKPYQDSMGSVVSAVPSSTELCTSEASQSDGEDDIDELLLWAGPTYDEGLWIVSTRQVSSMRRFNEKTIVFQPDSRLFCPKGRDCELYRQGDDEHVALYLHVSAKAISEANGESVHRVGSNLTLARERIPRVREYWILSGGVPKRLVGRPIVVWVHGFRQRYGRVLHVASHLLHRLRSATCEISQLKLAVVAFLWPCHDKSYANARADANEEAACRLANTLKTLRAATSTLVVVGHSLGSRVACRALSKQPHPICDALFLVAPALEDSALAPGGEFFGVRTGVVKPPTVFYSRRDSVLRSTFCIAEAWACARSPNFKALGCDGPSHSDREIGIRAVDLTYEVPQHNANSWLMAPTLIARLVDSILPQKSHVGTLGHSVSNRLRREPVTHHQPPAAIAVVDDYFGYDTQPCSPSAGSSSAPVVASPAFPLSHAEDPFASACLLAVPPGAMQKCACVAGDAHLRQAPRQTKPFISWLPLRPW